MASPAYSIIFSAQVSGAASSGGAGDPLIPTSAGGLFVLATAAARGARRTTGIALGTYGPSQPVEIQQQGTVDYATFNMGAGLASWVRVSAAGGLERCTPSGSDDVVGWCDADGTLHLNCGFITAGMANASTAASITGTDGNVVVKSGANGVTATDVAAGSSYVSVGATAATTGAVRLANNLAIRGRNSTPASADVQLIGLDNTNRVAIGANDAFSGNKAVEVNVDATTSISLRNNATVGLTVDATGVTVPAGALTVDNGTITAGNGNLVVGSPTWPFGTLTMGSAPATLPSSGAIRLPNAQKITSVTTGGATRDMLHLNASGTVTVGSTSAVSTTLGSTVSVSSDAIQLKNAAGTNVFTTNTNSANSVGTLSIGASPALTGALALENNKAVKARNAAGSADLQVVATNASNQILVGESGGSGVVVQPWVALGTGASSTGAVRLENNTTIRGRNAANSGDVQLIGIDSSNNVAIGANATYSGNKADTVYIYPTTEVAIGADGFFRLNVNTTGVVVPLGVLVVGSYNAPAATAGAIRMENAGAITARNAANNANLQVVATNSSNQVLVGESGGSGVVVQPWIAIGTSTAASGSLRGTNAFQLRGLSGTSTDLALCELASDVLYVGTTSAYDKQVNHVRMYATNGGVIGNGGSTNALGWGQLGAGGDLLYAYVPLRMSATPADAGTIRLGNTQTITSRNAANGANVTVIGTNAGDQVTIGAPVVGAATAQGAVDGMFVKSMAGATYALANTEYIYKHIKITGSGTNVIKLPLATDAAGYSKFIWNAGTGTLAVQDTTTPTPNAAAATLAAGTGAWFLVSNGSVKQMTAAFTVA